MKRSGKKTGQWYEKQNRLKVLLLVLMFSAGLLLMGIQSINSYKYYKATLEKAETYAENTVDQVCSQISDSIDNTKEATAAIISNDYVQQYLIGTNKVKSLEYINFIKRFLRYIGGSFDLIQDIAIIDRNEQVMFCNLCPMHQIWASIKKQSEEMQVNYQDRTVFDLIQTPNSGEYFIYSCPVYLNVKSDYYLGTCMVAFSNQKMREALRGAEITEDSQIYIYNSREKILVTNQSYWESADWAVDPDMVGVYDDYRKIDGEMCYILDQVIEGTDWRICCLVPQQEMLKEVTQVVSYSVGMGVLTLAVIVILGFMLWRNISRPIQELQVEMQKIGQTNIHQRLNVSSKNELGEISVYINGMLDQLEKMTRDIFTSHTRLYEAKILQQETEFFALQNQINPHFLYNTLECMEDIAILYDAKEIQEISSAMAHIFRYCIKEERNVRMKDEIGCVQEYIKIMNVRFPNRFNVEIKIEPQLMEEKILKFILQPIVENAIYHGLEARRGKGTLVISGRESAQNKIELCVSDNGRGMSEEKLKNLQENLETGDGRSEAETIHNGVGLNNIHRRIQDQYGADYGLKVESKEGEGTTVYITIGYLSESEDVLNET